MGRSLLVVAVAAGAIVVSLAVAGSAEAAFASFRTPSGNIGCVYSKFTGEPAYLRCDIRSGLVPKPKRPKGCNLEWGDSLSLAKRGKAGIVCHGDTAIDPGAGVLRYGTTWKRGPFRCTSRAAGLTCRNAAGRGFFMSRESWRRF